MKQSVSDSYDVRRKGRKSHNPIIFILDFLCQRFVDDNGRGRTYMLYLCAYLFAFNLVILHSVAADHDIDTSWLFWILVIPLTGMDYLYRWLRHRYIKKHNLPGPYGWGTLDSEASWMFD